jgi:cephalosporin hydroxylase
MKMKHEIQKLEDSSQYREMVEAEKDFRERGDGIWMSKIKGSRFTSINAREDRSDLPTQAVQKISQGKYYLSWKGIRALTGPLDMVLYPLLIWELKPLTVIEFGSYAGGSAVWLADILASFKIEGRVLSIDINHQLLDSRAKSHPKVCFLQGDCFEIEKTLTTEMLSKLPHPWLIIEDCHVNLIGILTHLHENGLQSGDYLVIEDTDPRIPAATGADSIPDEYEPWGLAKMNEIRQFLQTYEDHYAIDSYYTDFFGYNSTWNWNGFIKRL